MWESWTIPILGQSLRNLILPRGLMSRSELVLGVDIEHLEVPFLQAASDEVVPHPDVLAPFIKKHGSLPEPERTCGPP
jgi:hypothetical protein